MNKVTTFSRPMKIIPQFISIQSAAVSLSVSGYYIKLYNKDMIDLQYIHLWVKNKNPPESISGYRFSCCMEAAILSILIWCLVSHSNNLVKTTTDNISLLHREDFGTIILIRCSTSTSYINLILIRLLYFFLVIKKYPLACMIA